MKNEKDANAKSDVEIKWNIKVNFRANLIVSRKLLLDVCSEKKKSNLHDYFENCSRELGVGVVQPVKINCWYSPSRYNKHHESVNQQKLFSW